MATTINPDIIARMKEALSNAKLKLDEQADFIEAVKGEPLGYGIVMNQQTDDFAPSAFTEGRVVRVIRGPDQGSMGTCMGVTSKGEVRVKSYRSRQETLYTMFPKNLTKLRLTRGPETPEISNPKPWDFMIGYQVTIKDKTYVVSQEVDSEGMISLISTEDDETRTVYVGHPHLVAPLGVRAGTVQVLYQGRIVDCNIPRDFTVQRGDSVNLSQETVQIVSVNSGHTYGNLGHIRKIMKDDENKVEVALETGQSKIVYSLLSAEDEEVGARVSLDASNQVILLKIPEEEKLPVVEETGVSWDDIGGQKEAKEAMRQAIEWPILYKDLYAHYGKKFISGILLYGPPGTGKTLLGKAAATAIAHLHGHAAVSSGFVYVKGPELLNMYVGATEASIRALFKKARLHKKENGYPAIIFVDEAESILSKRGSGVSSDMEKTIVPMFLTEMNGMEESGAIVILATNRPDRLDPAITRDQRIDRKIRVDRPDLEDTKQLFELYLKKVPLIETLPVREAADFAAEELFSDLYNLCSVTFTDRSDRDFYLRHSVSGAMIATMVDTATSFAVARDLESGQPSGVCKDDLLAAIQQAWEQAIGNDKHDLIESHAPGKHVAAVR